MKERKEGRKDCEGEEGRKDVKESMKDKIHYTLKFFSLCNFSLYPFFIQLFIKFFVFIQP